MKSAVSSIPDASHDEVGPECTKYVIKSSMLLSDVPNLPELDLISNEIILELACFKDKHWQCRYKNVYLWVKELFGAKWPEQAPSQQAVVQSIKRLSAGLSVLKKCPTSATEREGRILDYLQCEYVLPQLGLRTGGLVVFESRQNVKTN